MKASGWAILGLGALGVIVAALWFTQRAVTPKEATWEDVLAEARDGGYRIIDTDELWEYCQNPTDLLVVDTRPEWDYWKAHIQGAVNFPLEPTAWSRWWKREALKQLLGPDKNSLIVFY
jgi:hypothetical protein